MKRLAAICCSLVCLALLAIPSAEAKTLQKRSLDRQGPPDWCPLGNMKTTADVFRFRADGSTATVTFVVNNLPNQAIDNVVVVEESEAHFKSDVKCPADFVDLSSGFPVFVDRFDSDANGWTLAGARFDPTSSDSDHGGSDHGGSLAFDPGGSASITFGGLQKGRTYVVSSSWSIQETADNNFVTLTVDTRDPAALYLGGGRFRVDATWRTAKGAVGTGKAVPLTDETGIFWFFDPSNVEVTVKVLNACGINHRYWFFASGLTDVQVQLRVMDTATGVSKSYLNPLHTTFKAILDTGALATCP